MSGIDFDYALKHLDRLPPADQEQLLELLDEKERLERLQNAREHFIDFVRMVWPEFIMGAHHKIMADAFDRVANGQLKRLIINMPPRFTKSELSSWLLPAWFLGKFPTKKIIQASNTESLAAGFGRRVRNLIDGEGEKNAQGLTPYQELFPGLTLAKDSQAAAGWHTNKGGRYFAIGVNGKVTGEGADIAIVDDAHSEQEAKQAEYNPEVFDQAYEWFTSGIRQRLQPGGAIIIPMCMTGDTNVLMADGRSKKLRDVRPGDTVATYEKGRIATSRIVNWQSSGVDTVYTVQTQSGRIVRANERHPFLVDFAGDRKWVRLRNLKPGMPFVSTKAVGALHDRKLDPVYAIAAKHVRPTTKSILMRLTSRLGIMAGGKTQPASNAARSLLAPKDFAESATIGSISLLRTTLFDIEHHASKLATALLRMITTAWSKLKAADALSASSYPVRTFALTGAENFASTMTTSPGRFADFFVTTATSLSATERRLTSFSEPPTTYDVTLDPIVSIRPDGREEVFDVEVERTENFIANGVVSHNTRWSKRDLTGQVIRKMIEDPAADQWEVIEFPAILEPDEEHPVERSMWPGFWPLEELQRTRASLPVSKWQAQYLQKPTSEEGAILKRDYWREWGEEGKPAPAPHLRQAWANNEPPKCDYIMQSWDCAATKNDRSNYNACTTWGVFRTEDPATGREINNVILLSAFRRRMEFPELKKMARRFYDEDMPDTLLIENKSAGIQLLQEFRRMGIPAESGNDSSRGSRALSNDKIARANAIADIFASGYVWMPRARWAEEVATECMEFPSGEYDDYVDTVVQAMMRFRRGGFIGTANDDHEASDALPRRRPARKY